MPSTIEEAIDESSPAYSNRCSIACGTLCIIVSTLFFFGNISMIMWLFEHKYPVKFSVICFMVASGVLFLTSFTSSLLLITKGFPNKKRTVVNSSEESVAGFTHREGTQEGYEMTTNISYREGPNLLQLPQKVVARKTPPPPYDNSANGLTTRDSSIYGNEMGGAQLIIQTLDDDGLNTNGGYYELEENNVHRNGEIRVAQRLINNDVAVKAQTSPKLIASLDISPSSSNEIKQQRVANSQFLLQARELTTVDASRSSFRDEQHGFQHASTNPERSPRPAVRVKRIPSTTLKRKLNTRMSMSQSDLDSETRKRTSPSNSNAEIHSNCNLDGSSQFSQSNWNAQVRTSHSSLTPEMTPKFLRRRAEVRTSHLNFKPAVIPRTSQSSLNIRNSLASSNPESEKPESVSNLNIGRQFESRSNWLLPTDRRFISHSNLNMNTDHQTRAPQTNSNSDAPHSASLMHTDSDTYIGNSSSNVFDADTQSHVKNLKKIYQQKQFVATSKDEPSLHKAKSFGSLTVTASESPQMETGDKQTFGEGNASANNPHLFVPGESVLDASKKGKQMTPQAWMSAWNHGFLFRSTDAERIVGVRL